jgi:hypothetical protein
VNDEAASRVLGRGLWTTIAGVVIVVGLVFLAAAFLPRWWSHRVGDQVNESITAGILLGLFCGFVFTLVALALVWSGLRRVGSWRGRALILLVAALLAAPNLLTLSIVVGTGDAAHAGDRTLDVEAPGFRGASLIGALGAAAGLTGVWYLLHSRRRARAYARRESGVSG